jgi:hypothetical protein
MNMHQNARLTPKGRELLIQRASSSSLLAEAMIVASTNVPCLTETCWPHN